MEELPYSSIPFKDNADGLLVGKRCWKTKICVCGPIDFRFF